MHKADIIRGLRELGLMEGDVVLLHSALSSLGHVEGGADTVVDAFLEVLGPVGTLVVPIFGAFGAITDAVKARPGAIRSVHPLAAVSALGPRAAEICRDHWKPDVAHGEDTPYTRIRDAGGYVCLLGVDQDRNTTLHTAEELLELPYLTTTLETSFATPEGPVRKAFRLFPGPHRDFIGLEQRFAASGRMKIGRIGSSVVRLIKCRDLLEIALAAGREDPAFALCDNPACADCVAQRAAIRRTVFDREAFRVVASSQLAGRYVPEMIENFQAAGVDLVEIDRVQGRAVDTFDAAGLAKLVGEFKQARLTVASARVAAVTACTPAFMAAAAAAGLARIVLPLHGGSAAEAALAAEKGIAVSFCNAMHDGETAGRILMDLKARGLKVGATFNAANFARAGDKPFLETFKTKVKRFIDGLDLEDATFEGETTPLARGNAEIKEMLSILRCATFRGVVTLTAANRRVGSLPDAAEGLARLLRAS